ncbi:MAG TPA: phosphoribosylformylglycinamidine synthase [Bacteroidales bacterium]|nr:phosphoribosylformylglycinamidine synthase [Bacteroidales bacterium]
MIRFFRKNSGAIIAVQSDVRLTDSDSEKLAWLFGNATMLDDDRLEGVYTGPRREMITPWSTTAVEITQNMGIVGIKRIEEFIPTRERKPEYDPMLQALYRDPDQDIFTVIRDPEKIMPVIDIRGYNEKEGLALSNEEILYLEKLSRKLSRPLTDSEVFGFSQINSEHCRHKIFNGIFIIDGEEKDSTLFQLIKNTTHFNRNRVVSAYKDNCAFLKGPVVEQFAPATHDRPDYYTVKKYESVLSLKAETHNFPTTVEPFYGASTGSGGEIRDRMAGGRGAFPEAGIAVYMTSYPRIEGGQPWEKAIKERPWLYHSPADILTKASNGASDFGNKFGQPLICGSLFTFEHSENMQVWGYDKVIMLAGGIGNGKSSQSEKGVPGKGDLIVMLGGDNYRIGMGGGAVSSVDTGEFDSSIELNAVQRANPEMQKRVYNAIRALCESDDNPVISIHDHGAGGHLNSLAELVEATGGRIDISRLPVGDPTLSAREIIGNESQERMGLIISRANADKLVNISEREKAPLYFIGEITGDHRLVFENSITGEKPIDLSVEALFGDPPRTIITGSSPSGKAFERVEYDRNRIHEYVELVLQLEEVACKDWLTNKVDRSVTGRIAKQQCAGPLQLPLNNLGAIALDYRGRSGFATSLGHAPAAALIDPAAGSVLSIAEALTNIIWAPLTDNLKSVSLSANWMWPCKNPGEDARLYSAVQAASRFAIELGINIPTGKDSLSMTQKYSDIVVMSPGTVIITAAGEVNDIRRIVEPVIVDDPFTSLLYIDMSRDEFRIGGSSLAQVLNRVGDDAPTVRDAGYFARVFNTIQGLIKKGRILAGHDISAGGMITTLLEMCFSNISGGIAANLTALNEPDTVKILLSQNPGIIIQVADENEVSEILLEHGISYFTIGHPVSDRTISIVNHGETLRFEIDPLRHRWFRTSYLFDRKQCGPRAALERFINYRNHILRFNLGSFSGTFSSLGITPDRQRKSGTKAAIIREKGVNGDREMAYALWLAGFDVRDVHMTDLMTGRETLDDLNMIVFAGGFSNSDVLGSAKGWAGAFRYNEAAGKALSTFFSRPDTLSLGVCNGCQLMTELGLIYPGHEQRPELLPNSSGKFESGFISVKIPENRSVMLGNMSGMELGVWVAHGEGRFSLPYPEEKYHIALKYSSSTYPANPNGSAYDVAGLCSDDGRHLIMMPHPERAFFPWQCPYYPNERKQDDVTPWIKAFINARKWIEKTLSGS